MSMPMRQKPSDDWNWVRVYYFEKCKDSLILDGVWPAVTTPCKCGHSGQAYFYRDWQGGPNVLAGIKRCCIGRTSQIVAALEEYVALHPSTIALAQAEQAHISESLRRHEMIQDTCTLRDNNSVVVDQHDPEGPFVKDPGVKKAYREYLSQSSLYCIRWLHRVRNEGHDRTEAALHLLVALIWLVDPARLRAHVSLMSHAIGLFNGVPEGGRFYHAFDAHYSSPSGAAIRRLVNKDVCLLKDGRDTLPDMSEFLSMLRLFLDDFFDSTLSGQYQPEPMGELINSSPAWRSWQMTVSLLYRTLNQLGITPLQRFLAGYMISRACTDIYGDDALDLRNLIQRSRSDAESLLTYFAPQIQRLEAREC